MGRSANKLKTNYLYSYDVRTKHWLSPGELDAFVTQGVRVLLHWQPCNFGGSRPMYVCPSCSRPVLILYGRGRSEVACRKCLNLAYQSQSETADDRLLRKANKLRARLGWEPGVINPPGGRPKHMRWAMYERLRMECLIVSHRVLMNYSAWVKNHSGMRRCEYQPLKST